MRKITKIKLLTVSIALAQQAYALELIQDENLGHVTGQDGISITHEISKAKIDQVNWVDYSDSASIEAQKMKLGLHGVKIHGLDNQSIISTIDFDVGVTNFQNEGENEPSEGVGIRLAAYTNGFEATVDRLMLLCEDAWCKNPDPQDPNLTKAQGQNFGALKLIASSPIGFTLTTGNGLFNKNALAHLDLNIQNISISHILGNNSLTLKDFNFNFAGHGYMYIEPDEGIVLESRDNDIVLERVKDNSTVHSTRSGEDGTNPGLNIDLRYNGGGQAGNLMRFGASGTVTNAKILLSSNQEGLSKLQTVGSNYSKTYSPILKGYNSSESGGLHLNVSADFKRDGALPTKFEIGHTGQGSYAIEFSNLSPLAIRNANGSLNTQNAYIDFGDIYVNTLRGTELEFALNPNIQKVLGNSAIYEQKLTQTDQAQNFALIAIRGFDFQSIAREAKFISDNSIAKLTNQENSSWGIGIPVYNLNANVALSEHKDKNTDKHGIAYNIVASTQGYGIDNRNGQEQVSTTSLLIIDGKKSQYTHEEVNYYAGLRNIDAFVDSAGVITYEDEGIFINADRLLIGGNAELAIGQLPGSRYDCQGCTGYVPHDNFARKDDVITTLAFKIDGKGDLLIIPGSDPTSDNPDSNFLSLKVNFSFNTLTADQKNDVNYLGSYFSLINKEIDNTDTTGQKVVGESSINLNKLQGRIAAEARLKMKEDHIVFDNQVAFNPKTVSKQVVKNNQYFQGDVALSYLTKTQIENGNQSPEMQKMASFAIPAGVMRSTLAIKPR